MQEQEPTATPLNPDPLLDLPQAADFCNEKQRRIHVRNSESDEIMSSEPALQVIISSSKRENHRNLSAQNISQKGGGYRSARSFVVLLLLHSHRSVESST